MKNENKVIVKKVRIDVKDAFDFPRTYIFELDEFAVFLADDSNRELTGLKKAIGVLDEYLQTLKGGAA